MTSRSDPRANLFEIARENRSRISTETRYLVFDCLSLNRLRLDR